MLSAPTANPTGRQVAQTPQEPRVSGSAGSPKPHLPSLISSPEGWGEMGTSVSLGSHQNSPALETRARKNPVSEATEARGQKTTEGCGVQPPPLLQSLIQLTAYVRVCEVASVMSDSSRPHGLQPARLLCPRGFSRQEYWSGLPCPLPGNLPDPGIELMSLLSPALTGRFFTSN